MDEDVGSSSMRFKVGAEEESHSSPILKNGKWVIPGNEKPLRICPHPSTPRSLRETILVEHFDNDDSGFTHKTKPKRKLDLNVDEITSHKKAKIVDDSSFHSSRTSSSLVPAQTRPKKLLYTLNRSSDCSYVPSISKEDLFIPIKVLENADKKPNPDKPSISANNKLNLESISQKFVPSSALDEVELSQKLPEDIENKYNSFLDISLEEFEFPFTEVDNLDEFEFTSSGKSSGKDARGTLCEDNDSEESPINERSFAVQSPVSNSDQEELEVKCVDMKLDNDKFKLPTSSQEEKYSTSQPCIKLSMNPGVNNSEISLDLSMNMEEDIILKSSLVSLSNEIESQKCGKSNTTHKRNSEIGPFSNRSVPVGKSSQSNYDDTKKLFQEVTRLVDQENTKRNSSGSSNMSALTTSESDQRCSKINSSRKENSRQTVVLPGSSIPLGRNVATKARIPLQSKLCDLVNKGASDITEGGRTNSGFFTAGGRKCDVPEAGLRRAQSMFAEVSNSLQSSFEEVSKKPDDVSEEGKSVTAKLGIGVKKASKKPIVSEERTESNEVNQCNPTASQSYTGFSTAGGKEVDVPAAGLKRIESMFAEVTNSMEKSPSEGIKKKLNISVEQKSISSKAAMGQVPSSTSPVSSISTRITEPKTCVASESYPGFTTARGKKVDVPAAGLKRIESMFAEVTNSMEKSSSEGIKKKLDIIGEQKSISSKAAMGQVPSSTSPVSSNSTRITEPKTCVAPESYPGFSTAGGKQVGVSETGLRRAESMFAEVTNSLKNAEIDTLRKKYDEMPKPILGQSGIRQMPSSKNTVPNKTQEGTSVRESEVSRASDSYLGFSTAGGKKVDVPAAGLKRIETMFAEVTQSVECSSSGRKHGQTQKPMTYVSGGKIVLSPTKCLSNMSAKSNASAKWSSVSESETSIGFGSHSGFSTARGKRVDVPVAALKRIESLFAEVSNCVEPSSTDGNSRNLKVVKSISPQSQTLLTSGSGNKPSHKREGEPHSVSSVLSSETSEIANITESKKTESSVEKFANTVEPECFVPEVGKHSVLTQSKASIDYSSLEFETLENTSTLTTIEKVPSNNQIFDKIEESFIFPGSTASVGDQKVPPAGSNAPSPYSNTVSLSSLSQNLNEIPSNPLTVDKSGMKLIPSKKLRSSDEGPGYNDEPTSDTNEGSELNAPRSLPPDKSFEDPSDILNMSSLPELDLMDEVTESTVALIQDEQSRGNKSSAYGKGPLMLVDRTRLEENNSTASKRKTDHCPLELSTSKKPKLTIPDEDRFEKARSRQAETIRKKFNCTIKPVQGSLFIKKRHQKLTTLKSTFRNGLKPNLENILRPDPSSKHLDISSSNALSFRFDLSEFYPDKYQSPSGIQLEEDFLLIGDSDYSAGVAEFIACFLASPSVDPKLVSNKWIQNHFRWIVWKLACYERNLMRTSERCLTPLMVLLQLKYRYDREIDLVHRSAFRKILEGDESPSRKFVCCVASISRVELDQTGSSLELELSDGWYSIQSIIDSEMISLIKRDIVQIGTKLVVHGAELVGFDQGCDPLEVPGSVRIKISTNSTRRARWFVKLGFMRDNKPIPSTLSHIRPKGGNVGSVTALVARVYPVLFLAKDTDGKTVFRNERSHTLVLNSYEKQCLEKADEMYDEIRREVEKKFKKTSDLKKYKSCELRNIKQPELLSNIVENSEDASLIQDILSPEQLEMVKVFKEQIASKINAEVQETIKKKLKNQIPVEKTTKLIKVRLVDLMTGCQAMLTIWRPGEDVISMLCENKVFNFYNLNSTGVRDQILQMSNTNQTLYEINGDSRGSDKYNRKVIQLSQIGSDPFKTLFGEIDVLGLIVHMKLPDLPKGVTTVYISDLERNFLAIAFWTSLDVFGCDDLLCVGSVVAASNLHWRAGSGSWKIPCVFASESSLFSLNPKQSNFQQEMKKFKDEMKKMDCSEYISSCRNSVMSIMKQKDGPSGSLSESPHSSVGSPWASPHSSSTTTPARERLRKLEKYSNSPQNQLTPIPRALRSHAVRKDFKSPCRKISESPLSNKK